MKYLLGIDLGSSSVKVSLIQAETGETLASNFAPQVEMKIEALQAGWAEQDPEEWYKNFRTACHQTIKQAGVDTSLIQAIGISYQMHGLVLVDKDQKVLRNSIIWCDSRAASYGDAALETMGEKLCLSHHMNRPGNFTAAKLKWVKENEPKVFEKIDKIMLPGDYLAMRLSGVACTTRSGLSEGIFWDFSTNSISDLMLETMGFTKSIIPEVVDTFSIQGRVLPEVATDLGLTAGTPITYRAGDQPNNALSLNVLNPGEVATTAGTSGVVYGVSEEVKYDPVSRVNTFAHVNHTDELNRLGILLCINGTGILNSWVRKIAGGGDISYEAMNEKAASVGIGSDGVSILPFGNGAERVLQNQNVGAQIQGVNFNIHNDAHLYRAAQEGIVFSFAYGMKVMQEIGVQTKVIRAGHANMFLSPLFRSTLANVTGATIELYNTDGSVGAARGAGIGVGYYSSPSDAFVGLKKVKVIEPTQADVAPTTDAFNTWENLVQSVTN